MDITRIGVRVRAARQNKGLDIGDLAKLADLHYNTVQRLETGVATDTSLEVVLKLSRALKVPVDELTRGCL